MYSHNIEEMTNKIVKRLSLGPTARKAIQEALTEYWHDKIALIWTADDVQGGDKRISKDDAIAVLQRVLRQHDCNVGVTWDTIEAARLDSANKPEEWR